MTYTPTQQTFLGCSITGFNTSFDWGSGGTISISLVEDARNFDELVNPQLGFPARFQYDSYIFDGVIHEFVEHRSTSGNRTLEAILTNPAQIVEGVQLIIGGYTGSVFTMYNLYNIYGQLELSGFGDSGVNEAGMNWYTLVSTLTDMVNEWPIRFNGVPYFLDLSEIPTSLPVYYRIGGDNLSLTELVTDICDACGCDYFWDLYGNTIKLRVAYRNYQPTFGAIQQFIDANGGKTASQIGTQLEYNTSGRFISGGQVESVYFQTNNLQDTDQYSEGELDDYILAMSRNATILPYFGLTSDGSAVLPKSIHNEFDGRLSFTRTDFPDLWFVNSSSLTSPGLAFPVGYPITLDEMRYALMGQKEWENYIIMVSGLPTIGALHNLYNPYVGINDMLELDAEISSRVKAIVDNMTDEKLKKIKPIDLVNLDILTRVLSLKGQRVYEFVRNIATEYFGRKFMVRLPAVYVKRDADTGFFSSSYEVSDSGYIEESLFSTLVNFNSIPYDTQFITDEQGKIEAFVKFTGFQSAELDLSNLSPNDYTVSGNNVFVKCSVEPEFVFLNRTTFSDPRAVITLPAPVYSTQYEIDATSSIVQLISQESREKGLSDDDIQLLVSKLIQAIGFDAMREPIPALPLIPAVAAIPVKSNTETYGPWFYTGSNGNVEYEQNPDMVPWNFGGFIPMNLMGNAMVSEAISARFISETGSVDVPGAPLARTGEVLIAGGPYVTGLSVTADANGGVTTNYRFSSWNVKPGKNLRETSDRYRKMLEISRKQKRNLRELIKPKQQVLTTQVRLTNPSFTRRLKSNTPHDMIMGEIRDYDDRTDTTVTLLPFYNAMNATQSGTEYGFKAGFTLDGLFRPYSTDYSVSGIAHFVEPEDNAQTPTVEDLNPLKEGHDIGAVIRGNTRPDDIKNDGSEGGRGIALKGPLVVSGWGYDTSGKPVPNEDEDDPTDEFLENYLLKSDQWKTGPVDLRWDNERGIWDAGGSKIKSFIFYGSGTKDYLGSGGIPSVQSFAIKTSGLAYEEGQVPSESIYIFDENSTSFLLRGNRAQCYFSNGKWNVFAGVGLARFGTVQEDIVFEDYGKVQLINGTFSTFSTSPEIYANFQWLGYTGEVIQSGARARLTYDTMTKQWEIDGGTCNNE